MNLLNYGELRYELGIFLYQPPAFVESHLTMHRANGLLTLP